MYKNLVYLEGIIFIFVAVLGIDVTSPGDCQEFLIMLGEMDILPVVEVFRLHQINTCMFQKYDTNIMEFNS